MSNRSKIKLFVVDDHKIVRDGIEALLMLFDDIEITASLNNGEELFERLGKETPDIILLDIGLEGMSGIEIAKKLGSEYPNIKIIILTAELSERNVALSIEAGVDGFLLKNAGKDKLVNAIRNVSDGEEYFDPDVTHLVLNSFIRQVSDTENVQKVKLTPRETEIVQKIAEGFSHKEIAAKLFISKRTVDTHVRNIMDKFSFRSKADIIKYAIKTGIVAL